MNDFSFVRENLETIKQRISQVAEKSGRKPETVKLVAVSKTYPVEAISEAFNAGQILFGENRVQELEEKVPKLPREIEWHLIGHLQGNKVKKAVETAEFIHSVDSVGLLNRIDRIAKDSGKVQNILLEVNVSGEESKFGIASYDTLRLCVESAVSCHNIDFRGLMTMAPYGIPECELRRIFSKLREFRDSSEREFGIALPELSMGMSSDFEPAIMEGATMIRIGTAIFGERRTFN